MRVAVLLVALLVAVAVVPPAGGDHVQTDGRSVSFDHKTGNEWWVEVVLGGPDADSVERVQAKDTDGRWVTLEKRDWGAYAASFHIEPGHDVRFRATWPGGERVVSCWFTHPEGEETCGAWHVTPISDLGGLSASGGLASGDPDGDGQDALFVPTAGGIQVHAWTSDGWQHTDTIAPECGFGDIAVGDADNDGREEVYASSDFNDLYRYVWDDGWTGTHTELEGAGHWSVSAIAVGDPDDDGQDEVYVGTITDDAPLIQVRIVDGMFEEETITEVSGGTVHIWIGDGDGDGDLELISGSQNRGDDAVRAIDLEGGTWTDTVIDRGHGSGGTAGVVAGDGDGDGRNEVFAARAEPRGVWMSTFDGTWSTTRIADLPLVPQDLFLGDADNDGVDELYVLANPGFQTEEDVVGVFQVRWSGTWQTTQVARPEGSRAEALTIGDPDEDGLQEIYTVGFPHGCCDSSDAIVQQVSQHPPPQASAVRFDHRGGNEWWVQVHVDGAVPGRVQAMDTGGPWKELELKDWGDWAASFHVEPGNDVRFRALVEGTWRESCWFTHPEGRAPDGSETCGADGDAPPPPGDFQAHFSTSGGNEWWVEVIVEAQEPLQSVHARVDGGDWIALEKKDWGAWAKSFHVEDGSLVQFRATSTGGGTDLSGEYRWPEGTKVSDDPGGAPPPGTHAFFAPRAGNEWWVETYVLANATVEQVEARADGGAWRTLSLRDWGTWAASFHAPDGSTVEFRATTTDGTTTSDGFLWPDAKPADDPGATWPQPGSYVRYETEDHSEGGSQVADATFVLADGGWHLFCDGQTSFRGAEDPYQAYEQRPPPTAPTDVAPGDQVTITEGGCRPCCRGQGFDVTVRGTQTTQTHRDGDAMTVETWHGDATTACCEHDAQWEKTTGILTDWETAEDARGLGELIDTDAPVQRA